MNSMINSFQTSVRDVLGGELSTGNVHKDVMSATLKSPGGISCFYWQVLKEKDRAFARSFQVQVS